jgi:hypothetical protein
MSGDGLPRQTDTDRVGTWLVLSFFAGSVAMGGTVLEGAFFCFFAGCAPNSAFLPLPTMTGSPLASIGAFRLWKLLRGSVVEDIAAQLFAAFNFFALFI